MPKITNQDVNDFFSVSQRVLDKQKQSELALILIDLDGMTDSNKDKIAAIAAYVAKNVK